MVFGNCGVLSEIGPNKGYVEMTNIDAETSRYNEKNFRYKYQIDGYGIQ